MQTYNKTYTPSKVKTSDQKKISPQFHYSNKTGGGYIFYWIIYIGGRDIRQPFDHRVPFFRFEKEGSEA